MAALRQGAPACSSSVSLTGFAKARIFRVLVVQNCDGEEDGQFYTAGS
jgi:hypothetical protein